MGWTLTDDVGAYRAAVGELLSSEPERNTVLLSVLASLTRLGPAAFGDAAPLFGWWPRDGAPRAAVLQTPPRPMLLTALPGESAGQLARALADRGAARWSRRSRHRTARRGSPPSPTRPSPVPGMRPSPPRRARWRPWMTWSPTGCTEVSCCSGRWRANRCRWPA